MEYHLETIQQEFRRRTAKNARYSLRAFASFLSLHPSALSRVLTGKQDLSLKSGATIVKKLRLKDDDCRCFLQSIVESRKRKEAARIGKTMAAPHLRPQPLQVSAEDYAKIARLEYLTLIELTFTQDFNSEPAWIARRLGIREVEARDMIDRLISIGLLVRDGKNLVAANLHMTSIEAEKTSAMKQKLQEQILTKASQSIGKDKFDQRAHYGMTLAINATKLPLAMARIREFIECLSDELGQGELSEVYQIGVQLFPLTTPIQPTNDSR